MQPAEGITDQRPNAPPPIPTMGFSQASGTHSSQFRPRSQHSLNPPPHSSENFSSLGVGMPWAPLLAQALEFRPLETSLEDFPWKHIFP